jgi:outer membrane protein assembly factor BamB
MSINGAPSGQFSGAKDKPNAISANASDGTVYFTAETYIFSIRDGKPTRVRGVTSTQRMLAMTSNEHSVYAGSENGFLHKINGDAVTVTGTLEGVKVVRIALDSDTLWVLSQRNTIIEVDANTLSVKRTVPIAFDGISLTLVKAAGEVWVGDKKGKIHVLALDSLQQTAEFVAHG